MKLLIFSDIHGNNSSLYELMKYNYNQYILLGDLIDYGPHSNPVIELIKKHFPNPVCNIRGNHEQAVLTDDYSHFSSQRGVESAKYTKSILTDASWDYIKNEMTEGMKEFCLDGKSCLAVHGSLEDIYWKAIKPGQNLEAYKKYDIVFSGHSHLPHFFEVFYEADDPKRRNKKKTIFINPGSVGQPRNHNNMAQFAVYDTETEEISMMKVPYDIKAEQSAFNGQVDEFYKERLEYGV